MGRKGVSKRKKAKVKVAPVSGPNSITGILKAANQPEQLPEKEKALVKDKPKKGKDPSRKTQKRQG